jgi:hypothetical protein
LENSIGLCDIDEELTVAEVLSNMRERAEVAALLPLPLETNMLADTATSENRCLAHGEWFCKEIQTVA